MRFDISSWKEFRIRDIFNVELSKGDIKADESDEGDVILVSSGETDNGVVKHIDRAGDGKAEIFDGNKITIDMFGNVFYQPEPFYAVSHGRVNVLSAKFDMNISIGLFLATVIKKEQFKYSYGRAVYSNEASEMLIKLPVDTDGNPDWRFMEDYIKSLHHKPLTTKNKPGQVPDLNVNGWKEFSLKELFGECERGVRITIDDRVEGDVPFCTAGEFNEGIAELIGNTEAKTYSNALSIDMFGNCFYHKNEFRCDDNILIISNSYINEYTGVFIAQIISQDKYRYNYGRQYRQKDYAKHKIKLPVDSDGNPDWQFMEDYIKSLPYGDRLEG